MSDRIERTPIRFGTDGWRAVIARDFTFTNLERVAQAYADYTLQQRTDSATTDKPRGRQLVIVGYDRRFLSEKFAQRAAEVLAGNNLEVVLFDTDVPTPVVSWAVRQCAAVGGVMITASHNPPEFNGFKIKAAWGGSAPQETTRAVESLVDQNAPQRGEVADGNVKLLEDAVISYKEQIANFIDLERLRRSSGLVIIDPMHGAGGRWVESFLQGGNLKAETIRAERDPLFGGVNPEPIDQNLE
ncbi:MAG: phosphoglucomutase/phosphomannomutase family protein, partial [Pyrinomonadaceae bacterium]|nr:phosphoglucomutase/phosphomannomutase family protein [Pyrinomonadaceae bacterium]